MKPLRQQIRLRVAIAILTASLVVGAGFSIFFYFSIQHKQHQSAQRSIQQLVITVQETASIATYLDNTELALEVVRGLAKNDLVSAARIISTTGMDKSAGQTPTLEQAETWLTFALKIPFDPNRSAGKLLVLPNQLWIDAQAREASLSRAQSLLLHTLVIAFLVYISINLVLTRPLKSIASHLHKITPGSDERVKSHPAHEQDEIGELTKDINRLLLSMQNILASERNLRLKTEKLEKQFRLIFEKASAGIVLLDQNNKMLTYNPAFQELLLLGNNQYLNTLPLDITCYFTHPQELLSFLDELRHQPHHSTIAYDLQLNTCELTSLQEKTDKPQTKPFKAKPEERWLHCLFSKIDGDKGEIIIEGLLYDVTERTQREQLTRFEAEHDALTHLLNRRAGTSRLHRGIKQALASKKHYVIMLLDLDKFKPINDTYGHEAGDTVLTTVSDRLKNNLREEDVIIRWGGDEFVIGLLLNDSMQRPDTNEQAENIDEIAQEILNIISARIKLEAGLDCVIGVSIGIACCPKHGEDLEQLLEAADGAMYEIKQQGRNAYKVLL